MAGSTILSRLSSSTRLSGVSIKMKCNKSALPPISPLKPSSQSRISRISRLPVELSCLISMMPLHNAEASARLRSLLSIDSQTWSLIPQGNSLPL